MATMTEETDLIVSQLVERTDLADSLLATTVGLIDSVRSAITSAIASTAALTLDINVGGVDTEYDATTVEAPTIPTVVAGLDTTYVPAVVVPPTIPTEIPGIDTSYVAPTEVSPAVPSAAAVAIGDAEWDRIFNRAAAQEARAGVAEEYNAQSEGMLRGMAIPSIITNAMVGLAQQRTMDRISSVAETSAIEQAKAAREDAITLTNIALDKFNKEWMTQISSEQARVLYEKLKIEDIVDLAKLQADMYAAETEANSKSESTRVLYEQLKVSSTVDLAKLQADMYGIEVEAHTKAEQIRALFERLELDKSMLPAQAIADYNLKRLQLELQNEVGHLAEMVQVYAQMTNGLYSGTNVGLGSNANYTIGQQVYNPTQGEVVQDPS